MKDIAEFLNIKPATLSNYYWQFEKNGKKINLPKRTFLSPKKPIVTLDNWKKWQRQFDKDFN
jgi:hypothetical protein